MPKLSKNPTPEGPALETPGRGYLALPPEGARIELPPSYLKKLPLFVYPLLFDLLVLDVFLDHLGIQTHCIHTVASGPKLITPIGFLS